MPGKPRTEKSPRPATVSAQQLTERWIVRVRKSGRAEFSAASVTKPVALCSVARLLSERDTCRRRRRSDDFDGSHAKHERTGGFRP
jgi:hypothetical protein